MSEISLGDDRARRVPIPHDGGIEYLCPSCESRIPTRRQIRLSKPLKYETQLVDLQKCPFCNFIFGWRTEATVVRG